MKEKVIDLKLNLTEVFKNDKLLNQLIQVMEAYVNTDEFYRKTIYFGIIERYVDKSTGELITRPRNPELILNLSAPENSEQEATNDVAEGIYIGHTHDVTL